jgi:integrase
MCAFAGLRLGEAAALRVSDVDFLRCEIHVRRQVQRVNGAQVEIRAPKYGSERTVYAPDELIQTISEHIRLHRRGDDPDRWLFPVRAISHSTRARLRGCSVRPGTRRVWTADYTTSGTSTPLG